MSTGREIRLIEEDEDGWSAIDEDLGVASCGDTREEALEMLDEAVELTKEAREADTDADPEALGIDPDEVPEEEVVPDAPWFDDADETA